MVECDLCKFPAVVRKLINRVMLKLCTIHKNYVGETI